jgi:F-type H+-transporting ATPase subunit c
MDSAAAALLGMGLAAAGFAGAGIGIGYIFGKMIEAVALKPSLVSQRRKPGSASICGLDSH